MIALPELKSGVNSADSVSDALLCLDVLVLVPGTVNYFYDVEGKRLSEALTNLGCQVELGTLDSYTRRHYDWCFLLNIHEIGLSYGERAGFIKEIRKLKKNCDAVVPTVLESVHTKWFNDSFSLTVENELERILDIGFSNQGNDLSGDAQGAKRFLFNGLTNSERKAAKDALTGAERPIPWTFVGQATWERLRLVEKFVRDYDPAGFVYLVRHVPYTESGPHLNASQFDSVLQRTRYKIWCSHHPYYYLESIRFRLALMAGCVPIKIVADSQKPDASAPFHSLIFNESDCVERLRSLGFEAARQNFVEEFCSLPSYESSLLELLSAWEKRR